MLNEQCAQSFDILPKYLHTFVFLCQNAGSRNGKYLNDFYEPAHSRPNL